ncbi:lipopolysaccharide kinase InaA family protein [Ferrimonas lipolytica]|uniref:Lipopolysaccharide kinase (Kdo/WaaP) family protein n=1 Tax=Ferrimonas lipolytica TaxID=2724191 RepID=A0A6H1UGY8_9GAMM|nr:lipopolysaccharide kinase InaA family protein [Ferrimonas lipolytica]QIZ78351.1 hypothetical protein HER31_16455 [Ferrimonas lipolytica]
MHYPFKYSVQNLHESNDNNWTLWLAPSIADQQKAIFEQLKQPSLSADEELKREPHKRVIRLGNSVIKWQRYRDPRRLIKANVHANERLTRKEGGILRTEWLNNLYLQEVGVAIPAPTGFAEQRHLGLITAQATITEYLPDVLRLKDHIDDIELMAEKEPWMIEAINLARQLHELRLYHLDFHHQNILFQGQQRLLIDNEKLLHTESPNVALHAAMLGRLGYGLRYDPAEQSRYTELALPEIDVCAVETFRLALLGKITGKVLTALVERSGL